jgi:prepilin-type N-terminal cleavage/methylation domain-containing protein/prepilin-type processing-associated H-X9-DG protein
MQRRKGFTLIELLVVIAIIAILAAILFPVFAQARDKARSISCLSNNKQLATAVYMYAQDYDEYIPVLGVGAENRGRWTWQITPYIKNRQVFTCPNTPKNNYDGSQWSDRSSYGWNFVLSAASGYGTPNVQGYSLAQIPKPADTIVIGETGYDNTPGWAMFARDPRKAPASDTRPGYWPQHRHHVAKSNPFQDTQYNIGRQIPTEGQCNYVFLDGHAKSLSVGSAFREADTEDGTALASVANSEAGSQPANTRYVLWNIY